MKTLHRLSVLSASLLGLCTSMTYAQNDTVELQTIVVSAAGYEQKIADAPASITVIDRQQLEQKNYSDITDVLRDIPGVVITGSGSTLDVSIRGMGSAYTLFLVDGKKQDSRAARPNGDDYGLEKGILPPLQSIERIEVIRGPMSSLYGSDAMGGVVNIITKKVPTKWSGSFEAATIAQDNSQAGDSRDFNLYVAGPLTEALALQLSAGSYFREEDGFVDGFSQTKRERLNSRWTYVVNDQHDIAIEANTSKQVGQDTVGKTVATGGTDGKQRFYRNVFSFNHHGRYRSNLESQSYLQYEDSTNPDRENTVLGTKGIDLKVLTANSQWNWSLGAHKLTGGVYFKNEELNDQGTNRNPHANVTEFSRWSAALFLEDTWNIVNQFDLTSGLRLDHDEKYGSNFSPRLYGVYHLNDAFTLKGGVSTGYKQPDLRSSSSGFYQVTGGGGSPTSYGRAIIRGNENLKPEKSMTSELALIWKGEQMGASLTAYYTQFKDKITEIRSCSTDATGTANRNNVAVWSCFDGGLPFYFISDRINVDEAIMQGVEATFDAQLTDWATFKANYTYTKTEQKTGDFKGQPLNKMPKDMFNLSLDLNPTDQLNLWTRYHYQGQASAYLSRTSMSEKTSGYGFYDMGLNYKFNRYLTAKLGIYNLFDKQVTTQDNGAVLDGRRYSLGFVSYF